ncbi:MAG: UbiA family prenyltransferase [Candidatus Diapherotrites archaeon]|nr:UbiA family prenyltransferase [Candidatus Diapherotrites archaeon]
MIKPWLQLIRPYNGIMTAIAVAIGFFVSSRTINGSMLIAMLSAFLIMSAGMIINDYFDLPIDKKSKPWRPLPSRKIKKDDALLVSILLFLGGIFLSTMLNRIALYIAIIASIFLLLYAASLSKKVFIGNMVVAFNTALTFIFGEAAATNQIFSKELGVLFLLSFLSTIAREIYMDIRDMKEDRKVRRTVPIEIGMKKAAYIASFFVLLSIIASPLPFIVGCFGISYLLIVGIADLYFIVIIVKGLRNKRAKAFDFQGKHMKIAQFIALLAFIIGAL